MTIDLISDHIHLTNSRKIELDELSETRALDEKISKIAAIEISNFRSLDAHAKFEVAKYCAKKNGWDTVRNIDLFGLSDEHVVEIVKYLAQSGGSIPSYIKKFPFTEEIRFAIAKLCAQGSAMDTAEHIKDFDLTEEHRYEIAKLCAAQDGWRTSLYFDRFEISPDKQEWRIDIAKLSAQNCGHHTAHLIWEYGIESEDARFEIAIICVENSGASGASISEFKLNEDRNFELAKMCAIKDPYTMSRHIGFCKFQSEERRFEIAKLCALRSEYTPEHINNFDLTDDHLYEIAKICARKNGYKTATYFQNFKIQDKSRQNSILALCLNQTPYCIEQCAVVNPDLKKWAEAVQEIRKNKHQDHLIPFLELIGQELDGCQFEWVKGFLEDVKDPHIRNELVANMAISFSLFRGQRGDRELRQTELSYLNKYRLVEAVYSMRAPHLYVKFIKEISEFSSDKTAKEIFEESYGIGNRPIFTLIHALLSSMGYRDFSFDSKMKLLKDNTKAVAFLELLHTLNHSSLDQADKINILKMLSDMKATDFHKSFKLISIILKLGQDHLLKNFDPANTSLTNLALKAVQNNLPIKGVEIETLLDTFAKFRNPEAIWIYLAGMKTLQDPKVMECLAEYASTVTDGTFLEKRYDLDLNPHLKTMGAEVVAKWRKPTVVVGVQENAGAFDPNKWLYTKLVTDDHMGVGRQVEVLGWAEVIPDDHADFKKACFAFADAKEKKNQLKYLGQMQAELEKIKPDCEFMNDIKGQFELLSRALPKGARVIDTDDAQHLLLCGTEVLGSCQRVDGSPELNKGLLGYLMNGQTRLIAVVNDQNQIVARSLIRLLWDGTQPVMFLERHYGMGDYQAAIEGLAKTKAKEMGLTLTSLESEGDRYPHSLESLGGRAPFEYCDGDSGVKANSVYTIRRANIIPPLVVA